MAGQIDLSGIFFLDQSKIASYMSNTTNSPMQTQLTDLQKQLQTAYNSLSAVNNSSSQFLSNQNDIAQIINSENSEINNKLAQVNGNVTTKKRVLELNESSRLRTAAYTSILLVIIFGLASFAFIAILGKTFTFIPEIVYDIAIVLIVCYCAYTVYYKYLDIVNRDSLNFNEVNQPQPDILTPAQIAKQRAGAGLHGDLLGSLNLKQCLGETCCGEDTVWDQMAGMCVSPADLTGQTKSTGTPPATTNAPSSSISTTAKKQGFSTMQEGFAIQPNSPNEFTDYSKI
jgi:hypothetical protein